MTRKVANVTRLTGSDTESEESIRVVEWVSWARLPDLLPRAYLEEEGGWFGRGGGERWAHYLARMDEGSRPYLEALREDIVGRGLKRSGEWHDNGLGRSEEETVPVFSDGTYGGWTWRGFADLMAAVWSEEESRDRSYIEFYSGRAATTRG